MNPHAWEAFGWLVATAVIIAGSTHYLRRGDDGLTNRQRARYAKQFAENEGKKPTPEQMRHYRDLGRRQRAVPIAVTPQEVFVCACGEGDPEKCKQVRP